MSTTLDFLAPAAAHDRHQAETLIAIADTKLVLGNWHIICLHNGKSLPDYAALLAMASAAFGHARALYDHLAGHGIDYACLERGRDAGAIHSLAVLDTAPGDWQDFIATAYLADQATWLQASRYLQHPDRHLAGLARRIGEETYFHLKYAQGWAAEFTREAAAAQRARDALLRRYPHALAWFPAADDAPGAGERRQAFIRAAQDFLDLLGAGGTLPSQAETAIHAPGSPLQRQQPLLASLFERIRFKDQEAAP